MSLPRPAAVVVLAAGAGTRMRSATPKVLHRIGGRSLLGHVMAAARGLEPERLAVVVRHERDLVAAHVTEVDPGAVVVDQDDIPGTGRAVQVADLPRVARLGRLLGLTGLAVCVGAATVGSRMTVGRSGSGAGRQITGRGGRA